MDALAIKSLTVSYITIKWLMLGTYTMLPTTSILKQKLALWKTCISILVLLKKTDETISDITTTFLMVNT